MKKVEEMIQTRLQKDRPSQMISMRIPVDVIEDLKEIAPKLGFTGYQGLIKAYISQGLRKHLEEFHAQAQAEASQSLHKRLLESLLRHGVAPEVIQEAEEEIKSA